ncbi:hypothetical protein QTG56_23980 (plasmid) [Rossellomorea sp. AcN35-11]|nr:hypothetical protein [Rossellomorea aquimaris]WJV31698.1 hypothetical protein QTG56_23980 [Rossellomorea sp. AcN35-11]
MTTTLSTINSNVLKEYIEEQEERESLEKLVQQLGVAHKVIYRGTNLPEDDLKIGATYRRSHHNTLSSWSRSRKVAEGFAFENIEDTLYEQKVPVLLNCYNAVGFDVNTHIDTDFSSEEEILCSCNWTIANITPRTRKHISYLEIIVEQSQQQ